MTKAAIVVVYPNGTTNTNVLPSQQAVGWAERIAADERACSVLVVFDDCRVSVVK